jgi:serine/threonine protein kinase
LIPFATDLKVARKTPGRLLPHKLGPYELFDHIGRGGMADIYRAHRSSDLGIVRDVAVKEVLPELRDEPRFAELLVAEAKLAARLFHTNIVRVEQLGRDDDTLYIAMEHVEGLDLRELFRRCARANIPIPVDLSLRVCMDVLAALDYAHQHRFDDRGQVGIVHRDVSPSNVLLAFSGAVKLCDFGIARASSDRRRRDVPLARELVEGKAGYMSPEQARGDSLDGRADVFALGIILFELLSGKKLYRAREGATLLDAALRADIPRLPAGDLPNASEVQRIAHRALARDPDDRYETAGEMLADLETYTAEARLRATSLRLSGWLSQHFEAEIRKAARGRELAAIALGRGPAATIVVVDEPSRSSDPDPSPSPTSVPISVPTPEETRPAMRPRLKKRKKRKAARMAKESPKIDDAPKSLEGTSADVVAQREPKTASRTYLIVLALLALVGIAALFALSRGR